MNINYRVRNTVLGSTLVFASVGDLLSGSGCRDAVAQLMTTPICARVIILAGLIVMIRLS